MSWYCELDGDGYTPDGGFKEMSEFLKGAVGDDLKHRWRHVIEEYCDKSPYGECFDTEIIYNDGETKRECLSFHTGGWSDCEDFISELKNIQKSGIGWMMFWCRTDRGGHYYFDMKDE